jgi:hypothetical protein
VTISGSSLLGGGTAVAGVEIGGADATVVSGADSNSEIVVRAGQNSAGAGAVVVTSDTGATVTLADAFTYAGEGQVTDVSPATGQYGTSVTISGEDLLGGGSKFESIALGGVEVLEISSGSDSDSEVVVRAGASSDEGNGTVVLISDTGAVVTLEDGWVYNTASEITSVAPESGQIGTKVTIGGTNLLGVANGTEISEVTLAGTAADIESGTSQSAVVVVATSNGGAAETGDVVLTADSGALSTLENAWSYIESSSISTVNPNDGQVGTRVTVFGNVLLGGGSTIASASLAGTSATVAGTPSNTRVDIVVGAPEDASEHAGNVVLISDTGAETTLEDGFTYRVVGDIDEIQPIAGQHTTSVTITGTALRGAGSEVATVTLAGVEASITTESDTEVVVAAGESAAAEPGDVVLTADTGAVVTGDVSFEYLTVPGIETVFPTSGHLGTLVTITGTDLRAGSSGVVDVKLVGRSVAEVKFENDTLIVVEASEGPEDEASGEVVVVTADAATITADDEWTYVDHGVVQSVVPSSGRVDTRVTIIGTGLCGGGDSIAAVELAGLDADMVDGSDCGFVTVTANDKGEAVTGDVVLTADTGARVTKVDGWSYIAEGEITSVTPNAGQADTVVTIAGTTLFGGGSSVSSVSFAGTAGFVLSSTDEKVVAKPFAPDDGNDAVGDVVLTSNTGVVVRLTNGWTYSQITEVSPAVGQRGTRITISGHALLAAGSSVASVSLVGVAVASIESESDTEIVVVARENALSEDVTGSIIIVNDEDRPVEGANAFTYKVPGAINLVEPGFGQQGTVVTLSGESLLGHGSVITTAYIADVEVDDILISNDTYAELVAAPSAATEGDIKLVADTGANIVLADGVGRTKLEDGVWHYVEAAVVESVSPGYGQVDTRVTITGTNMRGGGDAVTGVTLSRAEVKQIVSESDTEVVVVAEANVPGTECSFCHYRCNECSEHSDVIGPANGCTSCLPGYYLWNGKCVSHCADGHYRGAGNGTVVAIVAFSNIFPAIFGAAVQDAFVATVQEVLTTKLSEIATADDIDSSAVFADVAPVSYTQFEVGTGLNLRISAVVDQAFADDIIAIVNDLIEDGVLLTALKSSDADAYQYVDSTELSEATTFSPGNMCDYECDSTCSECYGGDSTECLACAEGSVRHENSCLAECPDGSFWDAVDGFCKEDECEKGDAVLTANTGAYATRANSWEYKVEGSISSIAPASGHGGTEVRIQGTGLRGSGNNVVGVTLGGTDATVVAENDTVVDIQAGTVDESAANADVVLTADSGATVTSVGGWEYIDVAEIDDITPAKVHIGTRVTISGANLLMGGTSIVSVKIVGIEVESIESGSADEIVVVANAKSEAGAGEVRIESDTGAFFETANEPVAYLESGAISTVVPDSGQEGTLITISGERMLGGGSSFATVSVGDVETEIQDGADEESVVVAYPGGVTAGETVNIVLVANTGARVTATDAWTELTAGEISGVNPETGQVGTWVNISGSDLRGGGDSVDTVTLAGVAATIIDESETLVRVRAGVGSNVIGDVVLVADSGATVTATDGWSYSAASTVSSVSPASGQYGTKVTVAGSNLLGGGSVIASATLGGVAAIDVVSSSDDSVVVAAGASEEATSGDDIVLIADSGASTVAEGEWSYLTPGAVSAVSPEEGTVGTTVSISGERLFGGGDGVDTVLLAGVAAESIANGASNTLITVAAGASTASTGDVEVVSSSGAVVTLSEGWSYVVPGVIESVSPGFGQYGTIVQITGTKLFADGTSLASVTLAGTEVNSVVDGSNSTIVTVVADHAEAGSGSVALVSNTGGRVTQDDAWEYRTRGEILAVVPEEGHEGSEVSLYGTSLFGHGSGVTSVELAGETAAIVEQTDVFISVIASAGSAGAGDIVITADSGAIVTKEDGWTYVEQGEIDSVVPENGQRGTLVTISGSNLLSGGSSVAEVLLAGVKANLISGSNDAVVVQAAVSDSHGAGDVVVTSDTGSYVALSDGFEYLVGGSITSVNPSNGQYGTVVTIAGSNLLGGGASISSVTLVGTEVETIVGGNDEKVTVQAAVSTAGAGDIVITANTGAVTTLVDGWEYLVAGEIDLVTPATGQVGTNVLIVGTNLLGGGASIESAKLADVDVFEVTSSTDTLVVLRAGASVEATGGIELVADTGATVLADSGWTYREEGSIDDVSPSDGQGGTYVVITGERLRGGGTEISEVSLAGAVAEIKMENDTYVRVRAAANGATTGHVVLTADSGAMVTQENGWTYNVPGAIATVTPGVGQLNTAVTIAGESLRGGADEVTSVTLGGNAATIRTESDTAVVAIVDCSDCGTDTVVKVESSTGAIVEVDGLWEFRTLGDVEDVSPAIGQVGTLVTITGSSLRGSGGEVATVDLAGERATIVNESDTKVVVIAADGDAGTGDVVLTADSEATVTLADGFEYATKGEISEVSPSWGQVGTRVTIEGTALRGAGNEVTTVTLAGVEVSKITSESDTSVEVIAAESDEGISVACFSLPLCRDSSAEDVVLTSDTGAIVTGTNAFVYLEGGAISAIEPSTGQVGTYVTISGSSLLGGGTAVAGVEIGGADATVVSGADSNSEITVRAGQNSAGAGAIVVTSDTGATVTLADAFTYAEEGAVSHISPERGQLGTFVSIFGSGLLGNGTEIDTVLLGGATEMTIESASDTEIRIRAGGSLELGVSDIEIVSKTGSIVLASNAWTYDEPSNITQICI